MGAWPFLLGASDYSDYRVVVCPDFIAQSGRARAFHSMVESCLEGEADETVRSAQVVDDRLGPCALFYRVRRVRKADGDTAYDAAGRPLLRVDGVVVPRGDGGRLDPPEAGRLIDRALPTLDSSFADFWAAKRRIPTAVSRQLERPKPEVPPRRPPAPRARRPRLVLVLASALCLSLLANAVLLWGAAQPEPQLAAGGAERAQARAESATLQRQLYEARK